MKLKKYSSFKTELSSTRGCKTGSALLIAMMVMASVLTVSVATSKLVLNEVVQSFQLDKATVAFYAAESGLERGLFQARKKSFDAVAFSQLKKTLDNNSSYQLVAKDTEDALYASLAEDESYQIDLFNSHSLDALADPIKSVVIDWDQNQIKPGSWLQINWTAWDTAGNFDDPRSVYISQASSPYTIVLNDNSAYLYRIRVIARNAPADNLVITAYSEINPADPVAHQVAIPARISIKAVGEYPVGSTQAARQAILVTLPEKSPLSGLYDYVLYSEDEIKKEN